MIKSDKTDPKDQIAEIWFDMFLAWPEPETGDYPFAKRPPEEAAIILKYVFTYFSCCSFAEGIEKGEGKTNFRVRRILRLAEQEIEAPRNERAWLQIKNKVGEFYDQLSERGLDSKSQDEQVVRYLLSEPGLWRRAQQVPLFRNIEDAAEKEFFFKLSNLVDAWEAEKATWRRPCNG